MIAIWPQYLDENLTLSEGRKISKEDAVKEPTINEIERALKRLGLSHNVQKETAYPGKWYEKSGRVLVEWDKTKLQLIREISSEIKKIRH